MTHPRMRSQLRPEHEGETTHCPALKDAEYLSIQVSCELERYMAKCAEVVGDDGLCEGQPDEDGCHSMQVQAPKFDPMSLNVEWKSLPVNLMYEILDFPFKAEIANQAIFAAFEYEAGPPDYWEGFEERHLQYATLGLAASQLATKLRKHVDLPARSVGDWNPVRYMEEKKSTIESKRAKRATQEPDL